MSIPMAAEIQPLKGIRATIYYFTVNLINIEGKSSIFHVCLSQTYFVGDGIKELPQNKYNTAD